MHANRKPAEGARRLVNAERGPVLRATPRGTLVVQTENARRMMRRIAGATPASGGRRA
jgi:hypothetical protein